MKRLTVIIFITLFACTKSSDKGVSGFELAPLLEQYSREYYALNPMMATANCVNDYNDQLEIDISQDHRGKSIALDQKYLDTLATIKTDLLTPSELLSVEILTYTLKMDIERVNASLGFNRPVDQFVFSFPTRFATLASGAGYVPFNTEKDYRDFISRMNKFQIWVDQAIANMQTGLELNNSNPKASMEKVPAQ